MKAKPGKKLYIVALVQPWSSISVSGWSLGACANAGAIGYCPVYTNKKKALKDYPKASLITVTTTS